MRIHNFSAGPSQLPLEVLKQAQDELLSYQNNGFSIMEISHRSKYFEDLLNEAKEDVKQLYKLDDNYDVIFIQGGASMQFSLIAMNYSLDNLSCAYVDTDVWTQKALNEAKLAKINAQFVASSKDSGYKFIPKIPEDINASYLYICSNNTVQGTQYKQLPKSKSPLVVDASSDFFSKELDFSNIAVLFGGVQKNAGIAGIACMIVRKDFYERSKQKELPLMFKYSTYVDNNSLYNTPSSFAIYIFALQMKWLKKQGGLNKINELNTQKAKIIYDILDNSNFYTCKAAKEDRSLMNVCFKTPNEELDLKFHTQAAKEGLIGLKGHKIVGGLRASLYNSCDFDKINALANYLIKFEKENR
ncbi:3-phosphoserine/phosphohydroxythreonine transaminase [Campylobacter canadensis]|uniref:Phosphoserine aminotransferase n=1 Tax=Campylobacter canadensis TaxID=449520 RepID=A0ABS7WSU7_9BACT|nr:3-phosphoserine/phosphohydroxythreonine transaminase [Campylobacter canadensis]MBZ7987050.1 3-phosphoserine/phosphohydroxythreonine transaminase [Campylobacter canadensis]MBZ7994664.1 3-phosphoserine/phosphohydroxythreonine transaminase [Campylobacter canadensis]MBZ7996160.1 3-phosphoserine/phosphohydroxythreonine transaminase [Campylobacter canadensis]MBZ7998086.1 3-phosphoserine/phosphohydroxythreonine transaminase [Campylobacter canadensis]MBZ8000024.1 3-phosphoserine/phosphohydroxythreo